jgi:hypothetical protein
MFLRIYANCRDDEAAAIASAIEVALVLFEPTPAARPMQYWKMPELFEFTYRLSSQTRNIWDELVAQSSGGWKVFGDAEDRSAVGTVATFVSSWHRRYDGPNWPVKCDRRLPATCSRSRTTAFR